MKFTASVQATKPFMLLAANKYAAMT